MPPTTRPGQVVFQLRVGRRDVQPEVCRLLVPGGIRLAKLHLILQAEMGWTNSHLCDFRIGSARYGTLFDDHPADEIDERSVTVISARRGQSNFAYTYDYGDGWRHDVAVESVTTRPFGLKFAVCLDGARLPARGLRRPARV